MPMTKKERARVAGLEAAIELYEKKLARARSLSGLNEPPPEPVPPPESFDGGLIKGWWYNDHHGELWGSPRDQIFRAVGKGCSSSTSHSISSTTETTAQRPRPLYRTREDALRALRYRLLERISEALATIDAEIAAERREPTPL